jgi:hypothetical protein
MAANHARLETSLDTPAVRAALMPAVMHYVPEESASLLMEIAQVGQVFRVLDTVPAALQDLPTRLVAIQALHRKITGNVGVQRV